MLGRSCEPHQRPVRGRYAAAYGKNFDCLRRIKAEVDPEILFRVNRNISPAA